MFVASRRIFPSTDASGVQKIALQNTWSPLGPELDALLDTPGEQGLNPGSYRQYRLRCLCSISGGQIDFTFSPGKNPFPAPGLQPEVLSVSSASELVSTCVSPWFTIGQGSPADLNEDLTRSAVLNAQCTGDNGTVFEIGLECWDFTSPSVTDIAPALGANSLIWTRPLIPPQETGVVILPFNCSTLSDSAKFGGQLNITSSGGESQNPFGTFELRLRGVIASEDESFSLTVSLSRIDGTSVTSWTLPGFAGDGQMQRSVVSAETWTPTSELEQSIIQLSWTGGEAQIFRLAIDAIDNSNRQVLQRQSQSLKIGVPTFPPGEVGTFHNLFGGGPQLGPDSLRDFQVKLSGFREDFDGSAVLTAKELGSSNMVTVEWDLPARGLGDAELSFQELLLSKPFTFGDGREPSMPDTDWDLSLSVTGGSFIISDLELEISDRPIISLPPTQVYCLELTLQSIALPDDPGLNFGPAPFTVSAWIANTSSYYEANDTKAPHVFLSHPTYSLSIDDDGSLCATVTLANGQLKAIDTGQGLQGEAWHYVTMVWTGSAIQLGVNASLSTTPAEGLVPMPGQIILGSNTFVGRFRSVTFWNVALTDDEVKAYMSTPPGLNSLIANIEFMSPDPLISAPLAPALNGMSFSGLTFLVEGEALAVTQGGCACMGADESLHLTDASPYTLEAWVLATPGSYQVLAGKLDTLEQGYGLYLDGSKIVSLHGSMQLTSTADLGPGWTHVATTFNPLYSTLYLYINGVLDASSFYPVSQPPQAMDNPQTLFTAGGRSDGAKISDSLTGFITEIRLWNVCRAQREVQTYMYYSPAVDAPGLIGSWGLNVSTSGNAEVIRYASSGLGIESYPLIDSFIGTRRTQYRFSPPTGDLWTDFAFEIIAIALKHLAGVELLSKYVIPELWKFENIRLVLTSLSMADIDKGATSGLTYPLQPLRGQDIVDSTTLTQQVAVLVYTMKNQGLLSQVLKELPLWTQRRILAKVTPGPGQAWIVGELSAAAASITATVEELQDKIKRDEGQNSRTGLLVQLDGNPVLRPIPLQIGGAAQTLTVELSPPPVNGATTIYMSSTDPTVLVEPKSLVIGENDTRARHFSLRCQGERLTVQAPQIMIWTDKTTIGGAKILQIDERQQNVIIEPRNLSFRNDADGASVTVKVSLAAIVDEDVVVRLKDITPAGLDPAPDKVLVFSPPTLTFTRQYSNSHLSQVLEVLVTMRKQDKEGRWPVADGKKVISASMGDIYARANIGVAVGHSTAIVMVQAGKGDSYIVADAARDIPRTMLIDGGYNGTWNNYLLPTLNTLGMTSIDNVQCTHFDADHIAGLIEMMSSGQAPNIQSALFNDADGVITNVVGDDSDTTVPTGNIVSGDPVRSKAQGRDYLQLLQGAGIPLAAPRGIGSAVSTIDSDDYAFFNHLNTRFFGPSHANVLEMQATGDTSEDRNRASTIMVLRSNNFMADDFTALFTGDAHDSIPWATDIRGYGTDMIISDHYTVMKVPHHGSARSESVDFYHAYTADVYLISTSFSAYRHPSYNTMEAILVGCHAKGVRPIIITSSRYWSSGIREGLIDYIRSDLRTAGARMFFFDDNMTHLTITWNDGIMDESWMSGMIMEPS